VDSPLEMESEVAARLQVTSIDADESGLLPAADIDEPLSIFPPESQTISSESGDGVRCKDAMKCLESSAPFMAEIRNPVDDCPQTVTIDLERHVTACEIQEAVVAQAVGQVRLRVADTISDLESRLADCERELYRHITAADQKDHALDQRIIEAERIASSLTALEQRLPEVDRCDRELARIELVVPQVERRLQDFNASFEQQSRAVTVNQLRKSGAAYTQVGWLEQGAASAFIAVEQATRASNALRYEISELHDQLQRLTEATQNEATKLADLSKQAQRHRRDLASHGSAYYRSIPQQFERRAAKSWWAPSPGRLIGGVVALALSMVVVTAVASVCCLTPPPLLASRVLTFPPMVALKPLPTATIGSSDESAKNNRAAPAEPPAQVAQTVASRTASKTSENRTAVVQSPSIRAEAAPAQFVGTLIVDSNPAGARVFVNQQPVGDTPIVLKGLRIGSYVLRLEDDGYERWSTGVTVSAVHETRVSARLERNSSR